LTDRQDTRLRIMNRLRRMKPSGNGNVAELTEMPPRNANFTTQPDPQDEEPS
jgi:hypothetical protein